MSGSMHRLSVQTDDDRTIDLVLPSGTPVAALLPVIGKAAGSPQGSWYLSRLDGKRVDESVSLGQNMIDNGDLLILTSASPPDQPRRPRSAFEIAATTGAPPERDSPSAMRPLVFVWCVIVATGWLCAQGGSTLGAVISGAGCVGSLIAMSRADTLMWCCSAILFGASSGYLTVPATASAPNTLLAATAACAVACVATRLHPRGLAAGAIAVSMCAPLVVAAAIATLHAVSREAVGALIATLAVTLLSGAPRLAVLVSGLTPDVAQHDSFERAHQVLTGLVIGSVVAAAVGTGFVATGQHPGAPVLCWLVAVTLLLRAMSYPDLARRWAVLIGGLLCATAAFIDTVHAAPASAPWLAAVVALAGLVALRIPLTNVVVERAISRAEVIAVLLVVPVGLWVTDIYTKVRGG